MKLYFGWIHYSKTTTTGALKARNEALFIITIWVNLSLSLLSERKTVLFLVFGWRLWEATKPLLETTNRAIRNVSMFQPTMAMLLEMKWYMANTMELSNYKRTRKQNTTQLWRLERRREKYHKFVHKFCWLTRKSHLGTVFQYFQYFGTIHNVGT